MYEVLDHNGLHSDHDENKIVVAATVDMRLDGCRLMSAYPLHTNEGLESFVKGARLHHAAELLARPRRNR